MFSLFFILYEVKYMNKQNKIKIIQYVPPLWNGLTNIFCFNISHIPNPVNSHIYIRARIICETIKKEILLYGCVLVQMSFRMCTYFFFAVRNSQSIDFVSCFQYTVVNVNCTGFLETRLYCSVCMSPRRTLLAVF